MNAQQSSNIEMTRDEHGVITAVMNVADQSVNILNQKTLQDLEQLLETVERDTSAKAVVFKSGKESGFLAGADLHFIAGLQTSEEAEQFALGGQQLFERLESLPIPAIAIIKGVCLGGGLEFALACRYRIVVDDPRTKLGCPEVELGLLPAWGGTQRLPLKIGRLAALQMLLTGKRIGAIEAHQIGLADAVCRMEGIDAAVAAILEKAPREGPPLPKESGNYPALAAIRTSVEAGSHDCRDRGYVVERQEFGRLVVSDTHRSLLGLFFQKQRARKLETWVPQIQEKPRPIGKIGVIGGGIMGAGIAHWAKEYGYDVVLIETSASLLDASLNRIRQRFDESVRKQTMSSSEADAKLSSIVATTDWNALADVDLAVEAVPEDMELKQSVHRDMEQYCPPHAVLTTNTSAMSIATIAKTNHDPSRVLGLHFFNPVHRMLLVEVIRPEGARDEDVARLIEFVNKLGKIPVVAANRPGFIVSRILYPYLDEAMRLNSEGVPTEEIDREIRQFGMPMGPLELLDQIGLDVSARIAETVAGLCPESSPAGGLLRAMVSQGNIGRKSGSGFYDYHEGRKGKARDVVAVTQTREVSSDIIRDRIMLRMANEAALCLEEKVVSEPWVIDLAMALGTGFCPFLGGPLRMCHLRGYEKVVSKLQQLQQTAGRRFAPAQWLIDQSHTPDVKRPKT